MGIEVLIVGMIIVFVILMAFLLRPQKREMTGAEKMAYESERGRIQAQQEFNNRNKSHIIGGW